MLNRTADSEKCARRAKKVKYENLFLYDYEFCADWSSVCVRLQLLFFAGARAL